MSAPIELPPLVAEALDLTRQRGYITSSRSETGRLLATLAATRAGTLAELGTGCGVGAAWIASGARSDAQIVTAEVDASLVSQVRDVLSADDRIDVVQGDWDSLGAHAPFSLLFLDVRDIKHAGPEPIADLIEPGGVVVLDDFTPCDTWPPMFDGTVDVARQAWMTDERFTTVEVMVAADAAVLIAARR